RSLLRKNRTESCPTLGGGQTDGIVPRNRPKDCGTTAKLGRAGGTLARVTRSLLTPRLLAAAADLGYALGLVRSLATVLQFRNQNFVNDPVAPLVRKNCGRELLVALLFSGTVVYLSFHDLSLTCCEAQLS